MTVALIAGIWYVKRLPPCRYTCVGSTGTGVAEEGAIRATYATRASVRVSETLMVAVEALVR